MIWDPFPLLRLPRKPASSAIPDSSPHSTSLLPRQRAGPHSPPTARILSPQYYSVTCSTTTANRCALPCSYHWTEPASTTLKRSSSGNNREYGDRDRTPPPRLPPLPAFYTPQWLLSTPRHLSSRQRPRPTAYSVTIL